MLMGREVRPGLGQPSALYLRRNSSRSIQVNRMGVLAQRFGDADAPLASL